jgi:O-antigen/teichoic acid export membrane protein
MTEQTRTASFELAVRRRLPAIFSYVSSTVAMSIGIASQLIAFVFLARHLGIEQFGLLMTITAATSLALNVCGLGAGEAFIRRAAREPTLYPVLLGHSLIMTFATGIALSVITVAGLYCLVPASSSAIKNIAILFIFAFSNIALFRWTIVTEQIFLGMRQFGRANGIVAGFGIARALVTVVATVLFGVDRLDTWALWHGAIHVAGVAACAAALWRLGAPQWRILKEEIILGVHFSTSYFFSTLLQNVDRLVLSVVAAPAAVGAYGVASRIVNTSIVTVSSFMRLRYPKLAVAGHAGVSSIWPLALSYLPAVLGLGLATSAGLWLLAPWLPAVFGKDYGDTIAYLQITCWLVLIMAAKSIPYDALGAAERHALRAHIFNIGGVISAALLAALTFAFGIAGMFIALFASQLGLTAAAWVALFVLRVQRGRS